MLGEALDVVRAMWSGRPLTRDGFYDRVKLDQGAPEPFPIPVWLASSAGTARAAQRAATCDRIFPNPADHELSPGELSHVLQTVRREGLPPGKPFEVAVRGNASGAGPDRCTGWR
jgi:alkanesulfonate monooxygenase SsuD/methylene tetrahydromethanopterin reductase-like flavin-dependent oxidoreductase (luciferase family)